MVNNQKICSMCIPDSRVPGIRFDEKGVCNYCKIHNEMKKKYPLNELGQQKLNQVIDKITAKGKNKKYDCIVGISGGTDSTYTLYMAKKLGLRPLAVHLDNGWNSDIAVNNMKKAVTKLELVYNFSNPKTAQKRAFEKAIELLESENLKKNGERSEKNC